MVSKDISFKKNLPLLKNKKNRQCHEYKTHDVIPGKLICFENKDCADRKYGECDHFLDHLQLEKVKGSSILFTTGAVTRNLKNIFEKCDEPADENDAEKSCILKNIPFLKLQVTIPCKRHEEVGNDQQEYRENCFQNG